jgi:PAS domain S-box-containing protein
MGASAWLLRRSLGRLVQLTFAVAPFVSGPIGAEPSGARLAFDHLTAEDGLPSNWVQGAFKDSHGFMWFGGPSGLIRYDAGALAVYRHDAADPRSLPFARAWVVLEDKDKNLWLAGEGLTRFDPATNRFQGFVPDGTPRTQLGYETRAILEDPRGHVWIGTNEGLNELDPAAQTFAKRTKDPGDPLALPNAAVDALALEGESRLWIGTPSGLRRLNLTTQNFESWAARPDEPLLQAEVMALYLDNQGSLWAATMNAGLFRVQTADGTVTHYGNDPGNPATVSTNRQRTVTGDGKGRIFVGTENGGLNIVEAASGRITRYLPDIEDPQSLNAASIYALRYDDQGILWVGTFNGGVNIVSPSGQRFETIRARRNGLSDPHVSAVLEDHAGNLWVGTDGGGISRRDASTGRWATFVHDGRDPASLRSNAILALAEDAEHTIWVGGWDAGLSRYDPRTNGFVHFYNRPGDPHAIPGDHVFTIRVLSSGKLLVGLFNGPFLFDPRTATSSQFDARRRGDGTYDNDICFAVLEDAQHQLWLGGDGRVDVVDPDSGRFVRYRHDDQDPSSLATGPTTAMLADHRGNVWVGTGNGLYAFTAKSRTIRRYGTENGFPSSSITGLLEDESGNLWVATAVGLTRFAEAASLPQQPELLSFDTRDGLQSAEFRQGTAFRNRDGRMYFGGPRGLNSFLPSQIERNLTPPPVVMTGLKIFNRPVPIAEPGSPLPRALFEMPELVLSYEQSMVTIEYAALNYLMPKKNQFAYMIEGVDREWNMAGTQRVATYPNLTPGLYVFRVRAWNNDGVENPQGAALRLRIMPPFWGTWWFRLVSAMSLALTAGLVLAIAYRSRVHGIEERRRMLESEVERRTADLQNEVSEHRRTEASLQAQIAERERAETEARDFAVQLAGNNQTLLDSRDALERENQERRRAEEQAAKERDLLYALMDNIPDLIYFKDRKSRFIRVNRAQAEALGLTDAQAAEGRSDADFLSREMAASNAADEQQIFSTGRPVLGKVERDERTGRWLLATKVPVRTRAGEIEGIVGIAKDITERKHAEERLGRELAAFREVVDSVARGDLTRRGDENEDTVGLIARAVNRMLSGFTGILAEVRETALSVSSSSSQILATSTRIARGAEQGRGHVHETAVSVEEMAASMAQVAARAESSAAQARVVLEHVREGDRAVDAAFQSMTKISTAATETAAKMKALEQRTREVFQIIELIDEIASQSKLLALNAAIEAAHAGELGRGFAVVAEEVRRLAELSTEATKQVSQRIDAIVEETQAALAANQNAAREVKEGWTLSAQARHNLEEISKLVQALAEVSVQIASSSREQTQATDHVARAMEAIANFTTESVLGAKETSHAVEDLVGLSARLNDAMFRFKIDE